VRVVRVRESWKQRERIGDQWVLKEKEQNWIWIVAGDLDGYAGSVIRDWGHLRWKIENNAFKRTDPGLAADPLRSPSPGLSPSPALDQNHRLHALSRLCHIAWQAAPAGEGHVAGIAQTNLSFTSMRRGRAVL